MDNARQRPIFIGAGANMAHPSYGSPGETLKAALLELGRRDVEIVRHSRWYRSSPVPPSDQPWYINLVAEVATELPPDTLLRVLHDIEHVFGRVRTVADAPRLIDLDLLDYRGEIAPAVQGKASLPHPRMAERAFVLYPLADLAPQWRHPVTGASIETLLASLPPGQEVHPA